MATITLEAKLGLSKDGVSTTLQSTSNITMVGADVGPLTQTIGTTTEQITFGDVTTVGYVYFKNTDTTHSVSFGLNTPVVPGTDAFCTLLPGESTVIPTRRTTIYALADTAPVAIEMLIVEL